jgi:cellobiose phosphorylase
VPRPCYFVPLGENLEIWRVRVTNERSARPRSRSSAPSSSACGRRWRTTPTSSATTRSGQVEVEDGVIYHKTEYRERRDHFAFFACSEPLAGFDTSARRVPGALPRLGPADRRRARPSDRFGRPRLAADGLAPRPARVGARRDEGSHRPARLQENPKDDKFDPPGSQTDRQEDRQADHREIPEAGRRGEGASRPARPLDRFARHPAGRDRQRARRPDGQHLERLPVHGHVQPVAVGFLFESGIGRGMGFRDSNQDLLGFVHMVPGRARERILDIAATQLPSGGAYHQYQPLTKRGQQRSRQRLQRRPGLAGPRRGGLSQGDRRRVGILDDRSRTTTRRAPRRRSTSTSSAAVTTPSIGSARTACRSSGGPTGTTASTSTASRTRPASPSRRPRTRPAASPSPSSSAACSSWRPRRWLRRSPGCAAMRPRRRRCRAAANHDRPSSRRPAGTAPGSGAPTTTSATSSGSAQNEEGQIFIEPQGICILAGIGLDERAPRGAGSVRERLATPHGIVLQQPAYSHYYLELGEISTRTRRATRRTPASSATPTRG